MPAPVEHIIVLDDDRAVLDVLGQCLREDGYACITTDDPEEALQRIQEPDAALLITDQRMPAMNGLEVLRRAKELVPDVAVIMITALVEVELAVEALRTGADDYVTKPIDLDEMSMAVARTLERRRLVLENREYKAELERRVEEATDSLKKANEELRSTQEYLKNLIESTVDAIITIDKRDRVAFANRGAQRMLGLTPADLDTTTICDLLVGGKEELKHIRRVVQPDHPLQNYETLFRRRTGDTIPVSISLSLIPDGDGRHDTTLAICKDITQHKCLERELKEMTIRDNLTGLYNQRYFYDRIEAEIERAKRQHHPLSLLLIDIDKFKGYNDAHGHLEGDRVLQEVAKVIMECTREHVDMGFRYGGDEFTVILPEAPQEQALQIAQRIRENFEEKRFDLLTLSVGLMTYDDSFSQRAFIQFTDSLMYDAKRSGGNKVYVYDPRNYPKEVPSP